ncbi:hypothetical protein [Sphingobium yanoikuyae]|uniref:hypothetical protein n=1 Tax=Sphingobium yanoikuyae TaxID=13690 RepID=UPI0022DE2E91|nr:hypothetical protein [Sphingobium yanoikuyae]WBQ17837.1 hypothetical protein PAE53_06450 [Sphingobium yanoikuyae]
MQDTQKQVPEITEQARAEARMQPNGWVYAIGGGYNDTEAVPPQAIQGAWKVDASGNITGEFLHNPNYDPAFRKRH